MKYKKEKEKKMEEKKRKNGMEGGTFEGIELETDSYPGKSKTKGTCARKQGEEKKHRLPARDCAILQSCRVERK